MNKTEAILTLTSTGKYGIKEAISIIEAPPDLGTEQALRLLFDILFLIPEQRKNENKQ